MTNRQPTDVKNLDQYDNPPLEWKRALDLLDAQPRSGVDFPTFVNTVDKTCRPHSAAIAAYWLDGAMYFVSGRVRESRAISARIQGARSPRT